jgi:hypothetical protein
MVFSIKMVQLMNAQDAARELYEQNQFQDWLIAVGVAYNEDGDPTGLVVHANAPQKARFFLPEIWQGYNISIHKSSQPKVLMRH